MNSLIIYLGIIHRIDMVLSVFALASGVPLIIMQFFYWSNYDMITENWISDKNKERFIKNNIIIKKNMFKVGIAFFIFLTLSVLCPTKKEFLSYVVLSEVDTYNTKNVDSKLNPQEVIKTGDTLLKTIDNVFKEVNEKIESAEK